MRSVRSEKRNMTEPLPTRTQTTMVCSGELEVKSALASPDSTVGTAHASREQRNVGRHETRTAPILLAQKPKKMWHLCDFSSPNSSSVLFLENIP